VERPEAVHICHRGSFSREVEGQVELTWWTLGTLVHLIRVFLGCDWQPSMMGVPTQGHAGTVASELFPKTCFIGDPERAWIAVPRRKLGAPPRRQPGLGAAEPAPEPPPGFVGSLRYALRNYLPDGHPNIGLAADVAGTSVRTLQRLLKARGRTYSEIVGEAKYLAATEMLLNPSTKVIDVALNTGYSDPSHFARAFRRTAGVSPREYRQAAWVTAPPPKNGALSPRSA
jgi:AraC-like DNA-binding protein